MPHLQTQYHERDEPVTGGAVIIAVSSDNRLVKLAQKLPWDEMLQLIVPDLQRTEKNTDGWVGPCESLFIWARLSEAG